MLPLFGRVIAGGASHQCVSSVISTWFACSCGRAMLKTLLEEWNITKQIACQVCVLSSFHPAIITKTKSFVEICLWCVPVRLRGHPRWWADQDLPDSTVWFSVTTVRRCVLNARQFCRRDWLSSYWRLLCICFVRLSP